MPERSVVASLYNIEMSFRTGMKISVQCELASA